jgi:hypothetical protein
MIDPSGKPYEAAVIASTGNKVFENAATQTIERSTFLPADTFRAALLECLKLQLKARHFAEALETWKRLEKTGVDQDTAAQIRSLIDRVEKTRTDDSTYAVSEILPDGQWHLRLFKRHFQVVVKEGAIARIKLRCDRGYVAFPLDPAMQYQVADRSGECDIELDGTPGTRFDLLQS